MQNSPSRDTQATEESHVVPPAVMTEACKRYFEDHVKLLEFVGFVSHLAIRSDEASNAALQALHDTAHSDDERERYRKELERAREYTQKILRRFTQMLLQLVTSRVADNFLLYVSELLALVFRTRPETLRSSDQVRFDVILEHESMEDLIDTLAERKVQDLSFRGMRDVSAWIEDRLGIPLVKDPATFERLVRIIETRNLIAHNRAVVSKIFLTRVRDFDTPIGSALHFTVDGTFGDAEFLARTVTRLEELCVEKFDLPATTAKTHDDSADAGRTLSEDVGR